jgi:lipopolysaccharide transport system permease protein
MRLFLATPKELIRSFWSNRQLILQMSKREAIGRYRGSVLGLAWSFFNPLLMLAIYTFVFTVVFNARWGIEASGSKTDFAIILFVGLIVHGLFAECINRSPGLIVNNVNYVKKVVFPLEILPWVTFGSALFHTAISLLVMILAQLLLNQSIPLTAILFPIVIAPLIFGTIGLTWFLAALGVYIRDVSQITTMFTTVMLYISAVFFPIEALPEQYQQWLGLNPLAIIIKQSRDVLVFGQLPNLMIWTLMLGMGLLMSWAGFAWFQKTRRGFADVL